MTEIWEHGYASLGRLLDESECLALRELYTQPEHFRSRIDMTRYRFGRGEYQYFAYPLPPVVDNLRRALFARLVPVAREWMEALGTPADYPDDLQPFLAGCQERGQTRPTPLLLRYRAGDYNRLHQDLYGAVVFPFQVVIGLSKPGVEYTGGELLLVEQQPRAQSIGQAIVLEQGEGMAITTRYRPVKGTRGYYRANMKHGVSRVREGERYTLGILFHDAE